MILDAAKSGHLAIFPEPEELEPSNLNLTLKEALEQIYDIKTGLFKEITILQALKTGLIDFRSAEIEKHHLLEAIDLKILDGKTAQVRNMSIDQAYSSGIVVDVEAKKVENGGDFQCLSLWAAIENGQLDTKTGYFFSLHEEKKTMTLEEALFRRYIDEKSALVKDTWKRQFLSLNEASRKKMIKNGQIMNTTTGKYVSVGEAIKIELLVREIRMVSLIEMLDFGMYAPHSGLILIPGLEQEVSLGEAIDLKLIDHTRTIVKSGKSNRYISLYEAIKVEGVIDSCTGMYAGSMNLLEARSKGYLLSSDAMVGSKVMGNINL